MRLHFFQSILQGAGRCQPLPAAGRTVFLISLTLFQGNQGVFPESSPSGSPNVSYSSAWSSLPHHPLVWPSSEFQRKLEHWSCGLLPASVLYVAAFSPVHSRDMSRHEALGSALHRRLNLPSWFPLLTVILSLKGEGPSWNQRL